MALAQGPTPTLQTQLVAANFAIDRAIEANKITTKLIEQTKKDIQYSNQQQNRMKAALQTAVDKTVQEMDTATLQFLHDV